MASKFNRGDKVRLTSYVAGYGPDKIWSVAHTLPLSTGNQVQVMSNAAARTFREAVLELANERVEGKEIRPEDVKVGDEIRTTYTSTAGNIFTRQGTVDESRTHLSGGYILSANGQDLYSANWIQVKEGPTIELVKAVKEPHPLSKAKPGDYFRVKRENKFSDPGFVRYTNIRDEIWVEEQFTSLGRRELTSIIPESDVRVVFDGHTTELVVI